MKLAVMLAALAMLQQTAFQHDGEVAPAPEHFKFQRQVSVPGPGTACAVLDASLFAHTGASLNALRLYSAAREIPFAVTVSGEADQQTEPAAISNMQVRRGFGGLVTRIEFDLAMPKRAYSQVDLDIAAKNFIATAIVTGRTAHGSGAIPLGTFTLFDLSTQGLGRNTTLTLQEEDFPTLHVELDPAPAGVHGTPMDATAVRGASVPPTREAQTVYTPVAETADLTDHDAHAELKVPAYVPIERVWFNLRPGYRDNFQRPVEFAIRAQKPGDSPDGAEKLGDIQRILLPAHGFVPEIRSQRLGLPVETMANARSDATVDVTVDNGSAPPVPVESVTLGMRQRQLCFDAEAGSQYELLYGDDARVQAWVYDNATIFHPGQAVVRAALLPETANIAFTPRRDARSYRERHPELIWVVLLAAVALMGGLTLHAAKGEGRRG